MSGKFDLGDYVEVKDRIRIFYELFGQGRLVTTHVATELGPDGKPRVIVEAAAYRTPDDPLPGRGWSWMELPGTSNYTRGSELENTETSAWGRAIASLGILIDKSIASGQEVQNKQDDETHNGVVRVRGQAPLGVVPQDQGQIGIVSLGKIAPVDGNLRQTPEGWSVGFVIGEGRSKVQAVCTGPQAEQLSALIPTFVGQRVKAFGPVSSETMTIRGNKVPFLRVALTRLSTPDGDIDLTAPVEAPTAPLFDESEMAVIEAAVVNA